MDMAMVMEERMMARRNSLLLIAAFGLLLTGCSKSGEYNGWASPSNTVK